MQTPPETPFIPQEGRSGGPKRRRRDSTSSDTSEDGAIFLGRRRRSISPEPTPEEVQPERQPRSQSSPRRYSNVSEDGAVFMGRDISRANTPQPFRRRALSINVPKFEGERPPRSPMSKIIYWLERPLNYGYWSDAEKREFWKQAALALMVVVSFMLFTGFSSSDCPPRYTAVSRTEGGEAVCVPTHRYSSTASVQYPTIVPQGSPTPSSPVGPLSPIGHLNHIGHLNPNSPNSPSFPNPNIPNSGNRPNQASMPNRRPTAPTGVIASQLWTFNPRTVAYAVSEYLFGNIGKVVSGAVFGKVGNVVLNKGSEMIAAEPDIHGWDVVTANPEDRAVLFDALRRIDEVSSSLQVQLGAQLFANQTADASDNLKRIDTLEALQTQLDELKLHQHEILKNLDLYHRASILASSALEDHLLFGRSRPEAIKTLTTLRSSMLETGSTLLQHTDSAEQNTAFVKQTAENLPWKTEQRRSLWRKWWDRWRYRGIEEAFTRLEHFEVYVSAVKGMVTSDVLALK